MIGGMDIGQLLAQLGAGQGQFGMGGQNPLGSLGMFNQDGGQQGLPGGEQAMPADPSQGGGGGGGGGGLGPLKYMFAPLPQLLMGKHSGNMLGKLGGGGLLSLLGKLF